MTFWQVVLKACFLGELPSWRIVKDELVLLTPSSSFRILIAFSCFTTFCSTFISKHVRLLTGGGSDDAEYSLPAYSTGLTTMESASFSILASIINPDMSTGSCNPKTGQKLLLSLFFAALSLFTSYQHNGNLFFFSFVQQLFFTSSRNWSS